MTEDTNSYEYLIKKQAMLNVDSLNERIAELEAANAFLKEQNDNLSSLSQKVATVYTNQGTGDFINFINQHLLSNGLAIEFLDSEDDGINLFIPDARILNSRIERNRVNYTVTGTVSFEWTVEVDAEDDLQAQEIAERTIADTNYSFYNSHEPDEVTDIHIDDYSAAIETVDIYEN